MTKPTTHHAQTHIEHNGIEADVDVGIAPLILALWRAGIPAHASCQGTGEGYHPDVSISFPNGWAGDLFVRLVKPWRIACEPFQMARKRLLHRR